MSQVQKEKKGKLIRDLFGIKAMGEISQKKISHFVHVKIRHVLIK